MSDAEEEVKFTIKMMVNKERTKVLFAESDGHFVDVLLSFLTLPLGSIVKHLKKDYVDNDTPIIGCLNNVYNSIVNLDNSHFWTEDAKLVRLNPKSTFDLSCRRAKLNISDSQPEYFYCENCPSSKFWSKSIYYDTSSCDVCGTEMVRDLGEKRLLADCIDGFFTHETTTFVITDDLRIVPNETGLVQTVNLLNITGIESANQVNVTLGLYEILDLLEISMTSQTPLSDLVFDKTNTLELESEPRTRIYKGRHSQLREDDIEGHGTQVDE